VCTSLHCERFFYTRSKEKVYIKHIYLVTRTIQVKYILGIISRCLPLYALHKNKISRNRRMAPQQPYYCTHRTDVDL